MAEKFTLTPRLFNLVRKMLDDQNRAFENVDVEVLLNSAEDADQLADAIEKLMRKDSSNG